MAAYTAHIDSFARDRLPPPEQWPRLNREPPHFAFPERLNAAVELLDRTVARGHAERPALQMAGGTWSYTRLQAQTNRIAGVLCRELGLIPGNRVLLRGTNTPMLVAAWLAVLKAGGIAVPTMPQLRAGELQAIVERTQAKLALSDRRIVAELADAQAAAPVLARICCYDGAAEGGDELERLMAAEPPVFDAATTAADDIAVILFTSGTTGRPKGAMHTHGDLVAITESFPRAVLRPRPEDVFIGSPPLAFAYGLGGLMAFPLRYGASAVLLEPTTASGFLEAVHAHRATICLTAPTAYRAMLRELSGLPGGARCFEALRLCASAGEALTLATFEAWHEATGLAIVDGIGTTEMLNHFISAAPEALRPGATGKPLPGYEAMIVDAAMKPLPAGEVGRLAVRGPTGCRYLDDERQRDYVVDGWNLTGDAFRQDEDGYFWYAARTDDMIVSSGYNIAGPEVEEALMAHPAVAECAVVAAPDELRGQIAKAFVVLADGHAGDRRLARELQDFVKGRIAPYKYPRAVAFLEALPRTPTGKVQRYLLKERAGQS